MNPLVSTNTLPRVVPSGFLNITSAELLEVAPLNEALLTATLTR
jgi:hypothetical protein